MKRIHLIDFGNSDTGTFGMVIRALATNPKKAIKRAKEILSGDLGWTPAVSDVSSDGFSVGMEIWRNDEGESIRLYVTPSNVGIDDLSFGDVED
mgnify:CR=1 FL=1